MDETGIYARSIPRLDRSVQIGVAGDRLISVSFPRKPDPGSRTEHALLDRIEAFLEGEQDEFEDVTVALVLPTAQRDVLETLRSVPYGESVTLEGLTRMTPHLDADDAEDRETARTALAENPTPLLVPDHRVVDGASAAPADVVERLRAIEGIDGGGR